MFNIKDPPICRVDEVPQAEKVNEKLSFWKKFDLLMQNKYVWSIFTVFLASLFPISKTIYDYRKKRARQLLRQQAQWMLEQKKTEPEPDQLSTSSSDEEHYDQLRPIEFIQGKTNSSSNSNKQKLYV